MKLWGLNIPSTKKKQQIFMRFEYKNKQTKQKFYEPQSKI